MISTLKHLDGNIFAYVEWTTLDPAGVPAENGPYVFVYAIWVHPKHRVRRSYQLLIDRMNNHKATQQSPFVYWEVTRDLRGKKIISEEGREVGSKRMSKIFNKEDILKKIFNIKYQLA